MVNSPCPEPCKRTRPTVYECPPPTPVILRCSVCCTAERDGLNIWSCVPFVSYSTFMGPTLADILMHILNMLPLSVITWFGIGHPRACIVKTGFVNNDPSNCKGAIRNCLPVCSDRDQGDFLSGDCESLPKWMREEYLELARELAELRRLTCEGDADDHRELTNARSYVLDRLAEMLSYAEKEKRAKKKKQKGMPH